MSKDSFETHGSPSSFFGVLVVSLVLLVVFSLGFAPVVFLLFLINWSGVCSVWWFWLILPVMVYIGLVLIIVAQLLISGGVIRVFHLWYEPGVHPYQFSDRQARRWMLVCALYTPCRKIMEVFPIAQLKNPYFRLLGMQVGKNTLVGGVIKDPCLTRIGCNSTIGEYAVIYGHITNYQRGTIDMRPVVIGDNCVIGAGAFILPGAHIEDDVTVAAGAVVTSNQVLKRNKVYAGIPAKVIR